MGGPGQSEVDGTPTVDLRPEETQGRRGLTARDPDLARRTVASFRRETAPGGLPWDVSVELERSPQMWSLRRRHGH